MKKSQIAAINLVSMDSGQIRAWGGHDASRLQELEAIARTVTSLRETLLDHSPMLAVSAEALEKAVALEIATARYMHVTNE